MPDRLSRLVQGISTEQRNDFACVKGMWCKKMLEEHGDERPATVSCWAQRLAEEHRAGDRAAFSVFHAQRIHEMRWRGARTRGAVSGEAGPQQSGRSCGPRQAF